MAAHHPLPRSGTHVMIATLVLMMMMMTLPSATADPTPISPAAGPLVGNELPHSTYSWDFGSVLGTTSGWWASWFPQCTQPYQAPINITTDTIINNAATKTLVLQTVSGKPMGLFDAIVAYNSTFNMVRCDVSSDHFLFYFYWAEDVTTPEQIAALPTFALNRFTVRFPSEHEINGQQTSVELRYVFSSTTRIASGQPTDITDESIGPNSSVSIVILLNETLDNEGDDNIELLFKQLMAGYSAGSTKIKAFFPSYETLYYYRGSQSIPPCAGGVDYFIGPTIYPIEASTLKLLQKYGPTWTSYRPIQATEGRPIMEVKAEMVNVLPKYRTTPAPVRYQVMDESLSFNGYGQRYGAWMAGLMCALLACCILFLLIERGTYTLPYYLSWRCPNSAREVFGVPVYFHCESGAPLMDDGTAPSSAGGSHNDDDEHRSSGGLGGGVGGSGGTNEAISSSTPLSVHSGHVATAEEGKKLTSSDESVSKPPAGGGVAGASSPHMQKVPIAEAGDDDDEDVDDVVDDDDEHNNSSM